MTHLALRQAARMTLMLASYLSKLVAETLRASQTSQGAPLIRKTYIFLRQITGFNPFIKSCCMRVLGTMPVWKEKGSDPAVGWSKLWLSRGEPRSELLLWIQRVSLIGLEAFVQPTL